MSKLRLAAGLEAVVELVGHARPQLVDQRLHVHVLEGEGGEQAVEHLGVVEVALDGLVDARVLHLDGHDPTVVEDGLVHLADGRGGDRFGVPVEEELFGVVTQLVAHHRLGQAGRHRRHLGLQGGQRRLGLGRQALGDEGDHLAGLHDGALHAAEDLGDVLGGLDGELLLELGPLLLVGPPAPHIEDAPVEAAPGGEPPHAQLALELVAPVLVGQHRGRARGPRGGNA